MEGWIKIHRKIKEHWLWDNPEYLKAWINILITVNYEPKKVLIRGQLLECGRGQSLISLEGWADTFKGKWTVQRVRTFFDLLKKDEMIIIEGLQYTTRLTVCNYINYQDIQQTNNKQITDEQQADNKPITTTKEGEEGIKKEEEREEEKVKRKPSVFTPPTVKEVIFYFKEKGYTEKSAVKAFDYYDVSDWVDSKGNKIRNWKQKMQSVWFKDENKDVTLLPPKTPKLSF